MIRLKGERELRAEKKQAPRRRRWLAAIAVPTVVILALLVERWRGQYELRAWERRMAAKGELPDPSRTWPTASAASVGFSNRLAQAMSSLPSGLRKYAGCLRGIVPAGAGQYRRGSHESLRPLGVAPDSTASWEELAALVKEAEAPFESLRQLMKDPPAGPSCDLTEQLNKELPINLVSVRVCGQALFAAAINALHQDDTAGANEDLRALLAFSQVYEDDPMLVNLMLRIAIIGLSVDGCWDALQAVDWTEPQLAALQSACPDSRRLLAELSRAMQAEQRTRLYRLDWFRSHSYQAWITRYQGVYSSLGVKAPNAGGGATKCWRQWIYHPLWSVAWADQEKLHYLQETQPDLDALRVAARQGSWIALQEQMAANHHAYHLPFAAWRFYLRLPLVDGWSETIGSQAIPLFTYPYADFSRAGLTAMKNLTLNEMVIAAIALRRYELLCGKPASSLEDLVPGFVRSVPQDFMAGQPLRYRPLTNGTYLLYSVGEDGIDNGGSAFADTTPNESPSASPWSCRDWVWPRTIQHSTSALLGSAALQKR